MSTPAMHRIRAATAVDAAQLQPLWTLVFNEGDTDPVTTWKEHARGWFTRFVEERTTAHFPVIEVDGDVVARSARWSSASPTRNALEDEQCALRTSSPCRSTAARGSELCSFVM